MTPRTPRLSRTIAPCGTVALAVGLTVAPAWAQDASQDPAALEARGRHKDESQEANPFRGSVLLFEQSVTTQTAGVGTTPQSLVPLYELWLSFRPRYHFDEHWSLRARFDYTKELTNSQQTTYYREDVFGDLWTDFVYDTKFDASGNSLARGTKAFAGARALWPTSKTSRANGVFVSLGAVAGASHRFELNGDDAPALNDFHLAFTASYTHPFSSATTPGQYGNFAYTRQNVDGYSFISDQIQGQTLAAHSFWTIFDTGLRMTPKLSFTGDLIFIHEWHYPPSATPIATATGPVVVGRAGDSQYLLDTWFVASLDYQVVDELDVSLGYYNLANALAPSGNVRGPFGADNIWWSPDARIFLDLTANLDVLFDDASRHKYSLHEAGEAARRRPIAELR